MEKSKAGSLWELLYTFMKIGLFTFGGGYAMIALIQQVCVEEKQWLTQQELMDLTVVAESTPGPIAINCATYVGHKQAGFLGALTTTLGVILPSFAIIYVISLFLENLLEIPLLANAFRGLRIAVGFLILRVGLQMGKKLPKSAFSAGIFLLTGLLLLAKTLLQRQLSSVVLLLTAAALALLRFALQKGKEGAKA